MSQANSQNDFDRRNLEGCWNLVTLLNQHLTNHFSHKYKQSEIREIHKLEQEKLTAEHERKKEINEQNHKLEQEKLTAEHERKKEINEQNHKLEQEKLTAEYKRDKTKELRDWENAQYPLKTPAAKIKQTIGDLPLIIIKSSNKDVSINIKQYCEHLRKPLEHYYCFAVRWDSWKDENPASEEQLTELAIQLEGIPVLVLEESTETEKIPVYFSWLNKNKKPEFISRNPIIVNQPIDKNNQQLLCVFAMFVKILEFLFTHLDISLTSCDDFIPYSLVENLYAYLHNKSCPYTHKTVQYLIQSHSNIKKLPRHSSEERINYTKISQYIDSALSQRCPKFTDVALRSYIAPLMGTCHEKQNAVEFARECPIDINDGVTKKLEDLLDILSENEAKNILRSRRIEAVLERSRQRVS